MNDIDASKEIQWALQAIDGAKIKPYRQLIYWINSVDVPVIEENETLANMIWIIGNFIFRVNAIETFALAELKRIEMKEESKYEVIKADPAGMRKKLNALLDASRRTKQNEEQQ